MFDDEAEAVGLRSPAGQLVCDVPCHPTVISIRVADVKEVRVVGVGGNVLSCGQLIQSTQGFDDSVAFLLRNTPSG